MHHHPHCHGRRFARGEHGPHRGAGRHGGGRRVFDQGDLRLLILHLIAERPRHGYEIIKAIEDQVGGAYSPSPGVVYPTLTLLEELGQVRLAATDGARKPYEVTEEGRGVLDANKPAVSAILARMAEVSAANRGAAAPQVIRATENLKLALRMRLSRGALTEAQAIAIAAALDAAASAVEQA